MALKIGELYGTLGLDDKQFNSALGRAESRFGQAADRMASMGRKLTLAITTPLLAVGGGMLKMAADARESEDLFSVSMGKMEAQGRAFSESFRKSTGMNSYAVRKMLGTFNVMTANMGVGTQEAYKMSEGLTKLTYDMASFYNLSTEDAFLKLQMGLSGQGDELRRLGLNVMETTVKEYAYTHAIAKQGEELTESQKVMARYGVIMEQTALAQGNLALTADSPANKLRRLKERSEELAIKFGQMLIPMLEKAVSVLERITKWLDNMDESQRKTFLFLGGALVASGPVMIGLANLFKAYETLKGAVVATNTAMALTPAAAAKGAGAAAAGGAAASRFPTLARMGATAAGIGLGIKGVATGPGGLIAAGTAAATALDWGLGNTVGRLQKGGPGARLGDEGGWLPNFSPFRAYSSLTDMLGARGEASKARERAKRAGQIADEYIKGGTHSLKGTPAEVPAETPGTTGPQPPSATEDMGSGQTLLDRLTTQAAQAMKQRAEMLKRVTDAELHATEESAVKRLSILGRRFDAEYAEIANTHNREQRALSEAEGTEKQKAARRIAIWFDAAEKIKQLNNRVHQEQTEAEERRKERTRDFAASVDAIIEQQEQETARKNERRAEMFKGFTLKMTELAYGETAARLKALDYERQERRAAIRENIEDETERKLAIEALDAELNAERDSLHREEMERRGMLAGVQAPAARSLFGSRRASMLAMGGAGAYMQMNPPVSAAMGSRPAESAVNTAAVAVLARIENLMQRQVNTSQDQLRKLDGMGTYRR